MDRYTQENKLEYQLKPHTWINSKWIKDLNISHKTIKVLEHIGSKVLDTSYGNIFYDISAQTMKTREKIKKWNYIKLKCFCTTKETIKKPKREPTK